MEARWQFRGEWVVSKSKDIEALKKLSSKSGGAKRGKQVFFFLSFLNEKDLDTFIVLGEGACGERLKKKKSKRVSL